MAVLQLYTRRVVNCFERDALSPAPDWTSNQRRPSSDVRSVSGGPSRPTVQLPLSVAGHRPEVGCNSCSDLRADRKPWLSRDTAAGIRRSVTQCKAIRQIPALTRRTGRHSKRRQSHRNNTLYPIFDPFVHKKMAHRLLLPWGTFTQFFFGFSTCFTFDLGQAGAGETGGWTGSGPTRRDPRGDEI